MSDPVPTVRRGFLFPVIAVALVFLFVWGMLPKLSGGGPSRTVRIIDNLRQIELMKQMWALDNGVTGSVQISEQDLAPYVHGYSSNGLARQVVGERYTTHPLGVGPEAQLTRGMGSGLRGQLFSSGPTRIGSSGFLSPRSRVE